MIRPAAPAAPWGQTAPPGVLPLLRPSRITREKTEKSGRSRIERTLSRGQVAEQVGFEPTVDFRLLRFSRPTPSATRPLLPCGARSCCARPIYHEKPMMQDHGYGGELYLIFHGRKPRPEGRVPHHGEIAEPQVITGDTPQAGTVVITVDLVMGFQTRDPSPLRRAGSEACWVGHSAR